MSRQHDLVAMGDCQSKHRVSHHVMSVKSCAVKVSLFCPVVVSVWCSLHGVVFNLILLLLLACHAKAVFSDPG